MHGVIEQLLASRGLTNTAVKEAFCSPDYEKNKHDPFLLPDMQAAVTRLKKAQKNQELVFIYGDYDIDGLTASAILLDAFKSFNIKAQVFIPNRFVDGYGLNKRAIKELASKGADLIVTVDCGSLSHAEVALSNQLGVDVIITDHHSVSEAMPPAVATINPKRNGHKYPFIDLAGCGVAFKLVQAMQQTMEGLPLGQEKWLLDLVALGTVCDVVQLLDENRTNVFWGLKVMSKTRRPGIRAMAQVAGLDMNNLNARSLGFVIGPHLNAAGRLETAQHSLNLLTATEGLSSLDIAYLLQELNVARRTQQDRIFKEALEQAKNFANDPVLVLSNAEWSHGIIGIVAAKVLETLQKPTFVIEELGDLAKGSARSFGDFSAVDAIRAAEKWLIKGGGHKLAAGVTLKTDHIADFRRAINTFYKTQQFGDQEHYLEPSVDAVVQDIRELNQDLMAFLKQLEPFGHGNPEPIMHLKKVAVHSRQLLGSQKNHLKLHIADEKGSVLPLIGFGVAQKYSHNIGDTVDVWFRLIENEWRGVKKIEGQLVKIQAAT